MPHRVCGSLGTGTRDDGTQHQNLYYITHLDNVRRSCTTASSRTKKSRRESSTSQQSTMPISYRVAPRSLFQMAGRSGASRIYTSNLAILCSIGLLSSEVPINWPSHPQLAPIVAHDMHKRPADGFGRHLASLPVPLRPARLGVGRRESGAKSLRPRTRAGPAPDPSRRRCASQLTSRPHPSSPLREQAQGHGTQAGIRPRRRNRSGTNREWRQPRQEPRVVPSRVPPRGLVATLTETVKL
jgi:hypothetical protein